MRSLSATFAFLLVLITTVDAIDVPGAYRCSAVRLIQRKNGRTYTKGFRVESLFIRFTSHEVRVFGTHGKMSVCRKLGIRSSFNDTLFLEDPEVSFSHSDLKLYMVKDTIMGNVNLFASDTTDISVKVLVKKLTSLPENEVEKYCH